MIRKPFSLCIALVALALAAKSERAFAADQSNRDKVTVSGPYTIREKMTETRIGRAQVEQVSITQQVSYADLNLSNASDVAVLKNRIDQAARDNCNKLRRSYPGFSNGTRREACVANAIRPNIARVDQIAMLGR